METIEEHQSKCEMMSISPSPENVRICLVGDVVDDAATVAAAQSFGVPIITSETGLEIINDYDWRTHFILNNFDGPLYEAIHKSKQSIMGPPALKHAADMKDGLKHNARPIYNYAMRGVVTCFTGIRKKDELTRLVNLIHSMGGCIRKDMNSKITHLISNHSGGEKYQYAKTFRLTVVRPAWVYAAWERRDDLQFRATLDEFSKEHKLKAFEGQKICFFGFPADEHQHMVEVLQSNGGVPADLDDPECSHVVMPNSGGYFPDTISNTSPSSPIPTLTQPSTSATNTQMLNADMQTDEAFESVDNFIKTEAMEHKLSAVDEDGDDDDDDDEDEEEEEKEENYDHDGDNDSGGGVVDDDDDRDARLFDEITCQKLNDDEDGSPLCDDVDTVELIDSELNKNASTPKSVKTMEQHKLPHKDSEKIVPKLQTVKNNISPILDTSSSNGNVNMNDIEPSNSHTAMDTDENCFDGHQHPNDLVDDDQFLLDDQNDLKRKRESSDTISLMSVDSFALPASTKKPKLIRAGSITRSIRRSMSFVAVRTPIAKMLRPRRSSVALDAAPHPGSYDADSSICSITSVDSSSVFNESISKPVKEKLRNLRDRITRSSSKKEKHTMISIPKTPEKTQDLMNLMNQTHDDDGFKTPKAPSKYLPAAAAASKTIATTPYSSSKSTSLQQLVHQQSNNNNFLQSKTNLDLSVFTTNISSPLHPNSKTNINTNISSSNFASTAAALATATSSISSHCNPNQNQLNQSIAANALQYEDTMTLNVATSSSMSPRHNEGPNDAGRAHPHTVVDEHTTLAKPEPKSNRTHILKSDWFWYTIQNGYADEMDYLFGDYLDSIANTPNTDRRESLPISFNRRKRRRFSQRIQLEGTPIDSNKRRSSVSDAGLLSVSGSFFDCTTSPDKLESAGKLLNKSVTSSSEQTPVKSKSMRFNHFMDFFSTESNYVGILDTIVNLFKNPLEEIAETNDALLNKSEIKAIFGNFLPIHEVHQRMLEHLRTLQSKWQEDCLIGEIILQHRDDLIKAYPPYVNFFEQMKEMLQHCDTQNPRFHAFLKINQTKPECGRQSLQDLMIRPVQRLPSISLLLNDILKHTNKNNPDYLKLEEALKAIKEVMAHINEDKRKTESRMAIFDIFNDIEGCPAHLVSSNRSLISKCEVTELSENLSGRGDSLLLYLFSDSIEVCKKRSRGLTSTKSPSTTKSHKHIKLMSLNSIRFVIDITDSPRAFALLYRQDKEKLHSFTISDEEVDKVLYLKILCKQIAENACRTDTDKALLCRTSQELDVDISDVNLSTLSKAFKLARRTRMQVGRAFSFNKTPSRLKRAVSTMMTSPFGSTNSLTPASQLAQMRLASCNNIHEVADEQQGSRSSSPSSQSSDVLVVPLSVQPMRKNKVASTLSVGRL